MNKYLFILLIFLTSTLFADKKYCSKITEEQRLTSVYLDLGNTNEKKFAINLLSSLKNNFLPHERLQIFTINPSNSTIDLVFNSCAPVLTNTEIKKVKEAGNMKYMFGGNPIELAKEDMSFFMASIKSLLAKIYKNNLYENYDSKNIIEILYNESLNFENTPMQRVIIYSDMLQNSEEIKLNSILEKYDINKITNKFKLNLNYSNIYIYTSKKIFSINKYNKISLFWKRYFELNNANVISYNNKLKLPSIKKLYYKKYAGKIFLNGEEFKSKIYINYTDDFSINNAWFIINGLDAIPLKGKMRLTKGKFINATLKISKLYNKHQIFSGDEEFILNIKGKKLEGTLKQDNTEIILNNKKITNPSFKIQMKEIY